MALVVLLSQPAAFCSHAGPASSAPPPPLPPHPLSSPHSLPLFSRGSSRSGRLVCSCKQEEFLPSSSSSSPLPAAAAAAVARRGRNWNWRRSCSERSSSSNGSGDGNGSGFECLIRELGDAARSAQDGTAGEEAAEAIAELGRSETTATATEKKKKHRSNRSSRRRLLALSLLTLELTTAAATSSSKNDSSAAAAVAEELGSPAAAAEDLNDGDDAFNTQTLSDSTGVIVDKFPEDAIEEQIIGDVFGFDGLGKLREEYVLGKVVALAQAGDGAVLFLGVDGFELPLQLVVGPAEAMAVLTAVQERKSRRPVTHEAWGLSLAAVGWKVDRVVITANEKEIFYSNVVLSNLPQLLSMPSSTPAGKKSVDMRPSDGIALALRCRAPLFVRRKVAEEILGPKADLPGGKVQVDPLLKQPGLQADNSSSRGRGSGNPTSVTFTMEKKSLESTSPSPMNPLRLDMDGP